MSDPAEAPASSPRRAQLLQRALAYAAENNLSDLSLRPLAAAIGSSPRVLLYLFGSKEGLIREVMAAERRLQLDLLASTMRTTGDPRQTLDHLWTWMTDPARRNLSRLFFEGYIRSLDDTAPWTAYASHSLTEWLEPLHELVGATDPTAPDSSVANPTLILAVLRGLLLDLLASGDLERVTEAWRSFADHLDLTQEHHDGAR